MNCVVYKIYVDGVEECYIGSTTTTIDTRLHQHILDVSKSSGRVCASKDFIVEHGSRNVKIVALETTDEANRYEREGWWIANTPGVLNKNTPQPPATSQTTEGGKKTYMERYRKENAETLSAANIAYKQRPEVKALAAEQHKVWAAKNTVEIKENRDRLVKCERCSAEFKNGNKWRHDATCNEKADAIRTAKETERAEWKAKAVELRSQGLSQRAIEAHPYFVERNVKRFIIQTLLAVPTISHV